MGGQMKSRAEASMRRIVDRVTKEAKARMERKPSGEKKGMSKGCPREKKKISCIPTQPRRAAGEC